MAEVSRPFTGTDEEWDALTPKMQAWCDWDRFMTPERKAIIDRLVERSEPIVIDPRLAPSYGRRDDG